MTPVVVAIGRRGRPPKNAPEYNLQIIEATQNQSKSNRFWPDMP